MRERPREREKYIENLLADERTCAFAQPNKKSPNEIKRLESLQMFADRHKNPGGLLGDKLLQLFLIANRIDCYAWLIIPGDYTGN